MLKNLLALIAGVVLLILGVMFSVVLLAVVGVAGLGLWGYVWWKTRKLRGAMRQQAPGGQVIDGEAIVVEEYSVISRDALPSDPPRQQPPASKESQP